MAECRNPGEVRLVNGERVNEHKGRVEICFQGRWSSVCDSTWQDKEAQVVCRQVGFTAEGMQLTLK